MGISEFIKEARNLKANIELIVKADSNDADYLYNIETFTPDEFEKYNIYDTYKKLKKLERRDYIILALNSIRMDDFSKEEAEEEYDVEFTDDDEEIINDPESVIEYIPFGDFGPSHTIEKVSLRIIIPFI